MGNGYPSFLIIALIIVVVSVVISGLNARSSEDGFGEEASETPQERAGRRGEKEARAAIAGILRDGEHLISNVQISFDGRPAELDNVIVSKYGVFIIEIKNYVGRIIGEEDDYEWEKYKVTEAGNIYEKNVRNPIKQVKRQVYILANYLRSRGADVWVTGYAFLIHDNSPVNSAYILSDIEDIDKALHTKGKTTLPENTVEKIAGILRIRS